MSFDSSFLFPIDTTKGCSAMVMEHTPSLYVPVIPPTLFFESSETGKYQRFEPKYLKYYIENCMRIGKIKRIDFAVREVPNFKTPQTCAFIHFDCLYENDITRIMLDKLQTEGKYKDYGFAASDNKFCRFGFYTQPSDTAHLLFKINHRPIDEPKDYAQNIEQVHAVNKVLTEKLQEKEEELRIVKNELEALKRRYEGYDTLVPVAPYLDSSSDLYQRDTNEDGESVLDKTIYPAPNDKKMTMEDLM
jgi:hypothetical protein